MTRLLPLIAMLATITLLTGCQDDDDTRPALEVPSDYSFTRDAQSTVSFSGQTTRIAMAEELAVAMINFDQTAEGLAEMFRNTEGTMPFADADLNASTKSIRSKVAASHDLFFSNTTASTAIRTTMDEWLTAQVNEVFPNRNEVAAAGQAGQIADGSSVRYVNANGLEYNQAIAKSLIGALMYDQAVNNYLSTAVLDEGTNREDNDMGTVVDRSPYTSMEHKWDEAFGYLFGGSQNPAKPLTDLGTADNFLNKYLGRVEDDADFTGIATDVELAFRTGRAAIVAGDYAERDRQATIIKENLTKVLAVRAVYYLKQGETALTTTPANTGGAFHDLSEGYGFIYSLRFVAGQDATVVEGWITDLTNASGNGFWDLDTTVLATIANEISTAYGISVAEAGN
ncbi:DUF4856 domain-containing protein [Neolewinella persica]|uniref:DUF4856 domain-containing protein n=1 Tax=Neolewinella persica TaxID=70998 RepID=UPI0003A0BBF7|nr:DUF4856 domain-containing protein [Neolewinella persica]